VIENVVAFGDGALGLVRLTLPRSSPRAMLRQRLRCKTECTGETEKLIWRDATRGEGLDARLWAGCTLRCKTRWRLGMIETEIELCWTGERQN
jgi:hypothetical protein